MTATTAEGRRSLRPSPRPSTVVSVRGVLPEHRHTQEEITESFASTLLAGSVNRAVVDRFHRNACVETRHTALPLEDYARLEDFGQSNDAFIRAGVELGARAVVDALKAVGLTPADVDVVVSCTVTGLAVPSIEARVAQEIGMRPDVIRLPLVGLGCVAGAAGVARLHDLLRGRPDGVAVLLSVELCSLTLQRDDVSVANLVASGLFGDGAAAVVAVGPDHPLARSARPDQPEVLAARSRMYPDSERTMGWDVGAGGLKIVLDSSVPDLVRQYVGGDVEGFLADHGLSAADIEWYVAHPGGPKVLEALQDALAVDRHALGMTWDSLRRIGNLSSASVLNVLADTLADRPPRPGSYGLMLAMGPGFCSELVLLRAPEAAA
ncbi:type III polyketide synthase [Nocardioides marmotae]|uniref:Type III polyketide synthase n=1 Tax=Nocardioides marmotae TaxID=2663857 RepID=A0A6I3IZL5_9ACTN|nr:3-oxoacyl-[acyl-carrier-protein] synthase III C-terminal domain-containing protein [Nocardioides marmotae]MCR6030931.1 type III polyketide synthase [Gordonia jinghuaiqii]MBC9731643.1 type III polyketide synthase [Nocardioides marmotae]MTB82765.1 type III polyketide synthase [Nocardioides marmotae]MTB94567.1 type III polyketide synthase [Nocardioides marmotae]QKE01419.1 type III polyketide synthase [Nocardioides marmotae]